MQDLGPRFVPTFLYYFVSTTLIALFVLSKSIGRELEVNPGQIAIALGILAGGLGGYFNSSNSLELPIKNKGGFSKTLKEQLNQLGYAETEPENELTVYQRPFPSNVFSGKLFVNIEKDTATISGRASIIRRLKKQLLG